MSFVHLHVHSEYSLLDGLGKIDDLISAAKKMGMPALALTDHGSLHGAIEFYIKAKKASLKPIIGMEGYLAKRSRLDKEAHVDVEPYHILLVAKDEIGYRNLIKLSTKAHLEGFYYKPRLDKEILAEHSQGLICLSGCVDGEIPRAVRENQGGLAKRLVAEYQEIFGPENFFIEVQNHEFEIVGQTSEKLIQLAKELDLPLIATNDVHYVYPEDAAAQDALLAIQTKETISSPKRRLTMIGSPTFYLRSPDEMRGLFYAYPEAIANTVALAKRCELNLKLNEFIYPRFKTASGQTADQYLRDLIMKKIHPRYGSSPAQEVLERLQYELAIIIEKGYADYFLIVQDFLDWAKKRSIAIGPGRGSGAGSLAAYVLGITNIDPLVHNLPFERFLNPERPSSPDFDLDFQDDRRDEVIEYTRQKYGANHVAQIVTFGRMEARAAVRDVARVLGHPYSVGDRIAKLIPIGPQGTHIKIEDAIASHHELKTIYDTQPEMREILDLAIRLQGVARHASTHAAGVVISDEPITNYVPLMRDSRANKIMTQYDMYSLDLNSADQALGLLKMDFLGLRNLTILQKALDIIRQTRGQDINIDDLSLDDAGVYKMISIGQTTGVFQLESAGMRRLARDLKPSTFTDIAAMVALFRPGPMDLISQFIEGKNNPRKIKYPHPNLQEILKDTYGVLVFQEQCLQIAHEMAGFSLGQADILRRAIGKKKKKLMQEEKKKFIKGAQTKGYSKTEAETVFGYIEKFAGYGFNRAHSASYAMIAYQTAYLKLHYPLEFMTALLTCESHNADKVALVMAECRRMQIPVYPPDINLSQVGFQAEEQPDGKKGIRFGLNAIKNVGEAAPSKILAERKRKGPFTSLTDFCHRVELTTVNRKVVESLIKVGAMDAFGTRATQLRALERLMDEGTNYQRSRAQGQKGLFDGFRAESEETSQLPEVEEFPPAQLLGMEKELLGFYLRDNPYQEKLASIQKYVDRPLGEITLEEVGQQVTVGGIITQIRHVTTRSNQEMAFIKLTDGTGSLESILFPNIFKNGGRQLTPDQVIMLQGRVDNKDDKELKLIAEKVFVPDL